MKTKQEYLDLLAKIENDVVHYKWEHQSGEMDELLSHESMRDYTSDFNMPSATWGKTDEEFRLPEGWLEGVPKEDPDYIEVSERYIEVYENMRECASIEMYGMCCEADMDEREAHSEFFRLV